MGLMDLLETLGDKEALLLAEWRSGRDLWQIVVWIIGGEFPLSFRSALVAVCE